MVIGILTISTFSAVLYLSEWQFFYLRSLSLAIGGLYFPFFLFGMVTGLGLTKRKWQYGYFIIAIIAIVLSVFSTDQPQGEISKLLVIAFVAIVFLALASSRSAMRIFPSRFFVFVGNYSYEIYLVHGILIFPALEYFGASHVLRKINYLPNSLWPEVFFLVLAFTLMLLASYFLKKSVSICLSKVSHLTR